MIKLVVWLLCSVIATTCYFVKPTKSQKLRELHRVMKTEREVWITFLSDEDIRKLDKNTAEILYIIENGESTLSYLSSVLDEIERIMSKIPEDERGVKIKIMINNLR